MTGDTELNKELAYDLRQIYANKVVGEHALDVCAARKAQNFSAYYEALTDLYLVIRCKLKNKDKKEIIYDEKIRECVKIANKNQSAWQGTSRNPTACAEIKKSLNEIEKFLWDEMEDANMLGSKFEDDGL